MTNESKLMKNKEIISGIEVLNKVGDLNFLPNTELATTEQVAAYYGVEKDVIRQLKIRNEDELMSDGIVRKSNKEIKFLVSNDAELQLTIPPNGSLLFPPKSILRVGMLLTNSETSKKVRSELLKENPDLYIELSSRNVSYFKKYEEGIKNYLEFSFGKENVKYQVGCGKYKLDFVLFNSIHIEVDENGHLNYNKSKEKIRADYILKNTGYKTLRYNPNKQKPCELMFDILKTFNNFDDFNEKIKD